MTQENNRVMYAVLALVIITSASSLIVLMTLNGEESPSIMLVNRDGLVRTVYLNQLIDDPDAVMGEAGFENRLNNTKAFGLYEGIRISDLIDYAGIMHETDVLVVEAADGYKQNYTYSNVYPNSEYGALQGTMILAFSLNETLIPEYIDGFRIMFLTDDGIYENTDAEATTPSEYYFGSAGSRCISNVIRITIVASS